MRYIINIFCNKAKIEYIDRAIFIKCNFDTNGGTNWD